MADREPSRVTRTTYSLDKSARIYVYVLLGCLYVAMVLVLLALGA